MHIGFRNAILSASLVLGALAAITPVEGNAGAMLDIDGNNTTEATTDGLLLIRYLFAFRGQGLVQDTVGSGATRTPVQIESYLASQLSNFDIDGNGTTEALTDGLLVLRYLSNIRGAPLVQGAIGAGATRTSAAQVEAYLATLTSGSGAQTAPAGCTVTATPSTNFNNRVQPGAAVQLNASCGIGTQPITFSWNNTQVGASQTVNPTTTTSYSVVASNGGGSSQPPTVTVYVNSPPTIGYCTAADDQYEIPWPPSGQIKLGTNGMTNQVSTFKLVVPSSFNPPIPPNKTGAVRIAEVPGRPAVVREVTLSHTPCDFHTSPGGYIWDDIGQQNGSGFLFTINNPSGYQAVGANTNIQPGDTVYISVRNYVSNNGNNPQVSCPAGQVCDLFLDFAAPRP